MDLSRGHGLLVHVFRGHRLSLGPGKMSQCFLCFFFCAFICDIPGSIHLAPDCKWRLGRPSSEIAGPQGPAGSRHVVPVPTHQTCRRSGGRPGSPCHLSPMAEAAFAARIMPRRFLLLQPARPPLLGWAPLSEPRSRKD